MDRCGHLVVVDNPDSSALDTGRSQPPVGDSLRAEEDNCLEVHRMAEVPADIAVQEAVDKHRLLVVRATTLNWSFAQGAAMFAEWVVAIAVDSWIEYVHLMKHEWMK